LTNLIKNVKKKTKYFIYPPLYSNLIHSGVENGLGAIKITDTPPPKGCDVPFGGSPLEIIPNSQSKPVQLNQNYNKSRALHSQRIQSLMGDKP
jgi:hypothetical protein